MTQVDGKLSGRSLRLEVKDFGPVAEAKIDLRPLTVFVGPSNTGKTYMAILIYALHKFFSNAVLPHSYDKFISHENFTNKSLNSTDKFGAELDEMLEKILINPFNNKPENFVFSSALYKILSSMIEEKAEKLGLLICESFGTNEIKSLIRKGSKATSVKVQNWNFCDNGFSECDFQFGDSEGVKISFPEKTPIYFFDKDVKVLKSKLREILFFDEKNKILIEMLAEPCYSRLVDVFACTAYYLPAGRTGIMQTQDVVLSAILAHTTTARSRFSEFPILSGVLRDFLDNLFKVSGGSQHSTKNISGLAVGIENEILEGSIKVKAMGMTNHPRFSFRPRNWKEDLPLMNVSSMVSELAPIVLYLRYMVSPGSILIIEEPEAHLHPAIQAELIRQIAILVNAGIRVIVTTHSEWFTERLGNIVRRSKITETNPEKELDSEPSLDPDQVGVWLFKTRKRKKGSIVKEVIFEDEGFYSPEFQDVAIALYNEWAGIGRNIGEKK